MIYFLFFAGMWHYIVFTVCRPFWMYAKPDIRHQVTIDLQIK